jgi:4'-phosphopantetheinyl transferase
MPNVAAIEKDVQIQVRAFSRDFSKLDIGGCHGVHIWQIQVSEAFQAGVDWWSLLTSEEKQRAERFKVENARDEFVVARGLLRTLLGQYLKMEPGRIRLSYEANDKPCLNASEDSSLHFNVSHSEGFVLAAFCRDARIGIDVEKVRRNFDIEAIWERFFSQAERQALASIPASEKYEAFFRCWTRKEAFIKALGEGLSHPLHQFDVAIGKDSAALLATRPDAAEVDRWRLYSVPVPEGYVAAVVVEQNSSLASSSPHHQEF